MATFSSNPGIKNFNVGGFSTIFLMTELKFSNPMSSLGGQGFEDLVGMCVELEDFGSLWSRVV
jgi:hypothetical protein